MMNNKKQIQRDPEEFISDLKFFRSNKLNLHQSVAFFAGLSYELILNRKIFPKNSDLKVFINEVYLIHNLDLENKTFKDYLYKSRTQLGARLTRTILDNYDYMHVKTISEEIEKILLQMFPNNQQKNTSKTNSFSDNISTWLNAISQANNEMDDNNE